MITLNTKAFSAFAPKALPNTLNALNAAIQACPELQDREVAAHWLGQMWVESAGFSTMVENLNYSVDGLLKSFGRHRISASDAQTFGRLGKRPANLSAIANVIYGGEWGRENLGNTEPGDGWRFRGSGFKQLTGRSNITESGFTPEELRSDVYKSAIAAAHFFIKHGCVAPAKAGDVTGVTHIINGGENGLDMRRLKTAEARKVIA